MAAELVAMAMLRYMQWRLPVGALLSLGLAVAISAPGMAAGPYTAVTTDLIPGPPDASWTVSTDDTGPVTVNDFYGSPTASAPGFEDAYRKGWLHPAVGLFDDLLHYTSVFWAAYALGSFKGSAQADADRTSFRSISGFGSGAFEVTYPADSSGYSSDWIFFARGDYMAALSVSEQADLGHNVVVAQARRQFSLLPIATAEYRSIGYGVLGVVLVAVLVIVVMAAAAVLIVILVRRRAPTGGVGVFPVSYGSPPAIHFSDDRRHWWDGHVWQDTAVRIPPGVQISPDSTQWWDGATWRRIPSASGSLRSVS